MKTNLNRTPAVDVRLGPPIPEKKKRNEARLKESENPGHEPATRSDNEPASEHRRVVTNEDDQSQITNADNEAMNEKEREGT